MVVERTGDWRRLGKTLQAMASINFLALHKEIGEAQLTATKRRFREGRDPRGRSWKPSIRARTQGGSTLMDSRLLFRSLTYKAGPDRVDIGTNDKRAWVHQEGKVIRPMRGKYLVFRVGKHLVRVRQVRMVARPFVGLAKKDVQAIRDIIEDRLKEALR